LLPAAAPLLLLVLATASFFLIPDTPTPLATTLAGGARLVLPAPKAELTPQLARDLSNAELVNHPAVVRLALGDVIEIDLQGKSLPLYRDLEKSDIVHLRLCRFPGAGAVANQICLAEPAEGAKPYIYEGTTPASIVDIGSGGFDPPNRRFLDLIVARPVVAEPFRIIEKSAESAELEYQVRFETTPIAEAFEAARQKLQPVKGKSELRFADGQWRVTRGFIR
jgi:hypothetical protein